jgi:hypothetical protein
MAVITRSASSTRFIATLASSMLVVIPTLDEAAHIGS